RKWREIALATPELWTAIPFHAGVIPFERQAHISRIWMSRSHSCPLSIQIEEYGEQWILPSEISALIVPHCERWEHLRLHLVTSHPPTECATPLLRHLDLSLA
ncbi:hypothetical protein B0H13DRAFT_1554141, partial [Mycena leptocephala]